MTDPAFLILVDADACPVKDEIYRVALRHRVPVQVVANSFLRVPEDPLITRVIVDAGPDVADDHIAAAASPRALVITADIPLAERSLNAGAMVLSPRGKPFTADSIGAAIATRALMEDLRGMGQTTSGPSAFTAKDRSAFLNALDAALVKLKRRP